LKTFFYKSLVILSVKENTKFKYLFVHLRYSSFLQWVLLRLWFFVALFLFRLLFRSSVRLVGSVSVVVVVVVGVGGCVFVVLCSFLVFIYKIFKE